MNTKRITGAIIVIFIVLLALLIIFLTKNNKRVSSVVYELPHQTVSMEDTHPEVPLKAGEHIVWADATSFAIYNDTIPKNTRIVKINTINKVPGGYTLNVSDFVWAEYGFVSESGVIETGGDGGLVAVDPRGPIDIYMSDSNTVKYISYKDTGEQRLIQVSSAEFYNHFINGTCFKEQYGCEDLRTMFWNIKLTEQGSIDSIQQEYEE